MTNTARVAAKPAPERRAIPAALSAARCAAVRGDRVTDRVYDVSR